MLNPWPHTLSVAVALATLASPALAQDISFNLPAGPLANSLNAIASQSGRIVSLEPVLVQGKQAPAVIGLMSAEQAMDTALRGSGLQLRITGQGNFSVEPAPQTGAALQLGATPYEVVDTMEAAVARAHAEAQPGETVLLAPAAASFDQYPNFEKRGDHFTQLVNAL